eukprot:2146756-Pleurochrysis_carterae.AAC.1
MGGRDALRGAAAHPFPLEHRQVGEEGGERHEGHVNRGVVDCATRTHLGMTRRAHRRREARMGDAKRA